MAELFQQTILQMNHGLTFVNFEFRAMQVDDVRGYDKVGRPKCPLEQSIKFFQKNLTFLKGGSQIINIKYNCKRAFPGYLVSFP